MIAFYTISVIYSLHTQNIYYIHRSLPHRRLATLPHHDLPPLPNNSRVYNVSEVGSLRCQTSINYELCVQQLNKRDWIKCCYSSKHTYIHIYINGFFTEFEFGFFLRRKPAKLNDSRINCLFVYDSQSLWNAVKPKVSFWIAQYVVLKRKFFMYLNKI